MGFEDGDGAHIGVISFTTFGGHKPTQAFYTLMSLGVGVGGILDFTITTCTGTQLSRCGEQASKQADAWSYLVYLFSLFLVDGSTSCRRSCIRNLSSYVPRNAC
jgi:hypothetical protein